MEAANPHDERRLPPIQQIAIAVIGLIVIGGVYTAAHLPRHVPQGPTIALLTAASVLLAVNVGLLARIENFAWRIFRRVNRRVLADDIEDGATLIVGGFCLCGIPEKAIAALREKGSRELVVVSNNCGVDDFGLGILLANKQGAKVRSAYAGGT